MKELNLISPLNIPEQKKGKYEIQHATIPKGTEMIVVSMRNAIMMGEQPCQLISDTDWVIHKLRSGGDVLMSDSPQETFLLNKGVKDAKGNVLIGGLGLGYVASKIIAKPNVKSVTVVELEKDIIDMVQPYIDDRIKVIHMDLFKYLESGVAKFNYAYFDIWYTTSERDWLKYVLPLRRLIWKKYGKKKINCWGEQEMEAQIKMSFASFHLYSKIRKLDLNKKLSFPVTDAFRKKLLQTGNISEDSVRYLTHLFLKEIGSPKWVKIWQWK